MVNQLRETGKNKREPSLFPFALCERVITITIRRSYELIIRLTTTFRFSGHVYLEQESSHFFVPADRPTCLPTYYSVTPSLTHSLTHSHTSTPWPWPYFSQSYHPHSTLQHGLQVDHKLYDYVYKFHGLVLTATPMCAPGYAYFLCMFCGINFLVKSSPRYQTYFPREKQLVAKHVHPK